MCSSCWKDANDNPTGCNVSNVLYASHNTCERSFHQRAAPTLRELKRRSKRLESVNLPRMLSGSASRNPDQEQALPTRASELSAASHYRSPSSRLGVQPLANLFSTSLSMCGCVRRSQLISALGPVSVWLALSTRGGLVQVATSERQK